MDDLPQPAASERRKTNREAVRDREVCCRTTLADGAVLEGMVEDISMGGAKISGPTGELCEGDDVQIAFVFLSGEEVGYRAVVRHIDPAGKSFGLQFTSEPQPIKVNDA